jgi:hypothetical protein
VNPDQLGIETTSWHMLVPVAVLVVGAHEAVVMALELFEPAMLECINEVRISDEVCHAHNPEVAAEAIA